MAACRHCDTAILLKERGPRKVSPFFIPGRLISRLPAMSRSSMARGTLIFGGDGPARPARMRSAAMERRSRSAMPTHGDGGTDRRSAASGWPALRARRSTGSTKHDQASRPYDKDRDGFVRARARAL
jgi:3-oxoacyl-[acyl-carrier-protein] synthase II